MVVVADPNATAEIDLDLDLAADGPGQTESTAPAATPSAAAEGVIQPRPDGEDDDAAVEAPLIIHREIQVALGIRVCVYWLTCVGYFAAVMFFTRWMYAPQTALLDHMVDYAIDMMNWVPAMMVLLPLVVMDMLRLSQRFLMPVVQVSEALQGIAKGNRAEKIAIEEESFLRDFVASYNEVCASVSRDSRERAEEGDELDSLMRELAGEPAAT